MRRLQCWISLLLESKEGIDLLKMAELSHKTRFRVWHMSFHQGSGSQWSLQDLKCLQCKVFIRDDCMPRYHIDIKPMFLKNRSLLLNRSPGRTKTRYYGQKTYGNRTSLVSQEKPVPPTWVGNVFCMDYFILSLVCQGPGCSQVQNVFLSQTRLLAMWNVLKTWPWRWHWDPKHTYIA